MGDTCGNSRFFSHDVELYVLSWMGFRVTYIVWESPDPLVMEHAGMRWQPPYPQPTVIYPGLVESGWFYLFSFRASTVPV